MFEPDSGGLGVALEATTTASVAQLLPPRHGRGYIITNDSQNCYWYGFGGASFRATLAYLPALPGTQIGGTFPNDASLTHISVITRVGSATGTINFGKGR